MRTKRHLSPINMTKIKKNGINEGIETAIFRDFGDNAI